MFGNTNFDFNLQVFILLVLCGILITCFVNVENMRPIPKIMQFDNNGQEPSLKEPFQTEELTIAQSAKYNKQLRQMFAANITSDTNATPPTVAYLNLLKLQTLSKTNPDDIIVTNFYLKNKNVAHDSPALDQLVAFILSPKENRNADFFLKADDGVDIDILFKYNYKSDFNDTVDVEAVVTEKYPTTRTLTEGEKAGYKSMTFDKCTIEYNIKDIIKLTLKKSVILPENAFILPQGVSDSSRIAGQKEVLQEFIIYIQSADLKARLDGNTNASTPQLELVVNNFIPYNSIMEYKVSMRIGNESLYTNYLSWQLYVKNIITDKVSANGFLTEKLAIKQKELLHDKYSNIITPMFMVDNKIANLDKSIQNLQATYNFNKLNNMATNIRFYPITQ